MPRIFTGSNVSGYGLSGTYASSDLGDGLPMSIGSNTHAWNPKFQERSKYLINCYWGTGTWVDELGTVYPAGEKWCGSWYYPQVLSESFNNSKYGSYGKGGTLRVQISSLNQDVYVKDYSNTEANFGDGETRTVSIAKTPKINAGDKLHLVFYHNSPVADVYSSGINMFLPEINNGTVSLYLGTKGETYFDAQCATLAQGFVGTYEISDTISLTENREKREQFGYQEDVHVVENIRFGPRKYFESLTVSDSLETFSIGSGALATNWQTRVNPYLAESVATNWHFAPQYKVLFDDNGDGDFATTNWAEKIVSYAGVNKSQRHWSGQYEASEWSPTFSDVDNELYGSLYNMGWDARQSVIALRAMVKDKPLTWNTQFTGKIRSTKWQSGKLNLTAQDELNELVNRKFVFDYECVGTVIDGNAYGVVKYVIGTSVMFDDKGNVSSIQRKKRNQPNWMSVAYNVGLAVVNGVSQNWVGVGVNLAAAGIEASKSGEQTIGAYLQISDDNLVSEDAIFSGHGLKFYRSKIDGTAFNRENPLYGMKEFLVQGGTFIHGIYGTIAVEDTTGINVGDYVYVKKPLMFSGNPNEIIKTILTGPNIDYPYRTPKTVAARSWVGKSITEFIGNDFATNWDSELSSLKQLSLYKIVDFESNPFDEIKELAETCQLYFFIDKDNKFAVSSIDNKDILKSSSNISTYSTGRGNILDDFSFERSSENAFGRVVYKYAFSGKESKYSKTKEIGFSSLFTDKPKTIESKWVHDDDDAFVLANRAAQKYGTGYDVITIPTTLFGLLDNVGDLIRVTHNTGSIVQKTFEIVSQNKSFDNSRIEFTAESVEYIQDRGLLTWAGSFVPVSNTSSSGWAVIGRQSDANVATRGTLYGSYSAQETVIQKYGMHNMKNRYIGIGSADYGYFEICAVQDNYLYPYISSEALSLVRGLFNTVSRPIGPQDYIYDLGPVSLKPGHDPGVRSSYQPNTLLGVRMATTVHINPLNGTSFGFF